MGFNWDESPVKKVAEDIRDNGESPLLTQSAQQKGSSAVVSESEKETTTGPTHEATVGNKENAASENKTKNTSTQAAKGRNHKRTLTDTSFAAKGKKTENGIVVNVPMEDYMQLTMMKFQTGRTLKDLALQAIHEFVERNK